MKEKRIFELSPIQKSWSDHIKRLATILDFGRYGGQPLRNFPGEPFFFQSAQCSRQLKTKNGCNGVGGVGKLYPGAPILARKIKKRSNLPQIRPITAPWGWGRSDIFFS